MIEAQKKLHENPGKLQLAEIEHQAVREYHVKHI